MHWSVKHRELHARAFLAAVRCSQSPGIVEETAEQGEWGRALAAVQNLSLLVIVFQETSSG